MQVFPWGKQMLWEVQINKYINKRIPNYFERILNEGVIQQDVRIPEVFSHIGTDKSHKRDDVHQRSCARISKEARKLCVEKNLQSGCRMQQKENQADQALWKSVTTNLRVPLGLLQSCKHISQSLLFFTSSLLDQTSSTSLIPRRQPLQWAVPGPVQSPSYSIILSSYVDNTQL